IPPEVVDHIVKLILDNQCSDFSAVASFSLACHSFRQIAFRRFFSVLFVTTKLQWSQLCQIPGMYGWVRTLDATTTALSAHPQILRHFTRLTSVKIDFSTEGLHTHEGYTKLLLSNLPASITSLEFSFLPSITPHLLSDITVYCPNLESLALRCTDRLRADCCWTCYEDSASCTVHSPLPDVICDFGDLTRAYGEVLSALGPSLRRLHLGVYLSSVDIFYDHVDHASTVASFPSSPPEPFAFLDRRPFPPSECSECQAAGYLVEEVRATEMVASAQMKVWLPRLESMCWSTWFSKTGDGECPCALENDHGDTGQEETASLWLRWGGKETTGESDVQVKRTHW
ncbi:hypothetical protein BDW22DRAFT_1336200, partial [Trametopsis cervina]